MDGHYYWVISTEDFILQKLKVGRSRDFEDAASVTDRLRDKLDREYLEHWARQLGVREKLDYPTPVRGRCEECEYRNYCGDIF